MAEVSPCLWFDYQAHEAAQFYTETFRQCGKQASIEGITHYAPDHPHLAGKVMTVAFKLADQQLMGLNGGSTYQLSPAISLVVTCRDQAQLDMIWEKLSAGGQEVQCGWLTDRYGLSWQVVPEMLAPILQSGDQAAMDRIMPVLVKMIKLDIAELERARDNG